MFYVVLILGLTNLFLTAALYRVVQNPGEIEVKWIGEEDFEPYLQMLIPEEPEPSVPEPPDPVPAPVPDGPWRNQKNIEPWAPTSSARSGIASQERGPLERPPGFV